MMGYKGYVFHYWMDGIPEKYLDNLQKKDYLLKMGNDYETTLDIL